MKKLILTIATFFTAISIQALPFNSKLSESEKNELNEGKVLIKSIDRYKNMSISSENKGVKLMRSAIDDLDPNYLAEIIQVKPVKGNETLDEKIYSALVNIESYVGIPYQASSGGMYELYEKAEIHKTTKISDTKTKYETELYMEPFGTIFADIEIERTDDYIFYRMVNTNKLKYKGFTAVGSENLASCIVLFKDGDNWILYGCGGADAIKIPLFGFDKKIEGSLIRRIKTFCNFIFTKF